MHRCFCCRNSRLGTEHRRLLDTFGPKEVILDLMAGVGPFVLPVRAVQCCVGGCTVAGLGWAGLWVRVCTCALCGTRWAVLWTLWAVRAVRCCVWVRALWLVWAGGVVCSCTVVGTPCVVLCACACALWLVWAVWHCV